MANERTYLQWFNAANIVGIFGSLILLRTPGGALAPLGYSFIAVALYVLIYATLNLRRRVWYLEDREASHVYADRCGPSCLCFVLVMVLVVSFIQDYVTIPPPVALPTQDYYIDSVCLTGVILPLHVDLIGLAYNSETRTLYGVDSSAIFKMPLDNAASIEYLFPLMGGSEATHVTTDIRGIALHAMDEKLYAYVGCYNNLGESSVYEVDIGSKMVTRRFSLLDFPVLAANLTEVGLRGMAMARAEDENYARLYVGLNTEKGSLVMAYDIPSSEESKGSNQTISLAPTLSFTPLEGSRNLVSLSLREGSLFAAFNQPSFVTATEVKGHKTTRLYESMDVLDLSSLTMTPTRTFVVASDAPTVLQYAFGPEVGFGKCRRGKPRPAAEEDLSLGGLAIS